VCSPMASSMGFVENEKCASERETHPSAHDFVEVFLVVPLLLGWGWVQR